MQIRLRRAYDPPESEDGLRILVERLWPRGLTRERAAIDHWPKEIAPSPALRKWYGHDPSKWAEFRTRYRAELRSNPDGIAMVREWLDNGPVTFVFGSRETRMNSAAVLKEYLEGHG